MSYFYQKYPSPVGTLYLVECEAALYAISFDCNWPQLSGELQSLVEQDTPLLQSTKQQLTEYFEGRRKEFTLPYRLHGTDFQNRAWQALLEIPYGTTRSYQEQARAIASPKAARAIGRADGLNRLCIVLPCHRVIGSDGTLTGFGGGLSAKKFLLALEQRYSVQASVSAA